MRRLALALLCLGFAVAGWLGSAVLAGTAKAPQIIDGLLRQGFMVYDALFAWLRFAAAERHNWPAKAA